MKLNLKVCKDCKQLTKRVSRKGYCPDCSIALAKNAITQLQAKEGEVYDKWLAKAQAGLNKEYKK